MEVVKGDTGSSDYGSNNPCQKGSPKQGTRSRNPPKEAHHFLRTLRLTSIQQMPGHQPGSVETAVFRLFILEIAKICGFPNKRGLLFGCPENEKSIQYLGHRMSTLIWGNNHVKPCYN